MWWKNTCLLLKAGAPGTSNPGCMTGICLMPHQCDPSLGVPAAAYPGACECNQNDASTRELRRLQNPPTCYISTSANIALQPANYNLTPSDAVQKPQHIQHPKDNKQRKRDNSSNRELEMPTGLAAPSAQVSALSPPTKTKHSAQGRA